MLTMFYKIATVTLALELSTRTCAGYWHTERLHEAKSVYKKTRCNDDIFFLNQMHYDLDLEPKMLNCKQLCEVKSKSIYK